MSDIDDTHSPTCTSINMIHAQNEALIIWLPQKVYFKCLGAFLCPLQLVEGHDEEKTSAAFHSKPDNRRLSTPK